MRENLTQYINNNILSTIGQTPCLEVSKDKNVYLKLENFNPTGSISDRLLFNCTIKGNYISYSGSSMISASVSLIGTILEIPVYINPNSKDGFTKIASCLGETQISNKRNNIIFNKKETIHSLVKEIKNDLPNVTDIHFSDQCPLFFTTNDEIKNILGVNIHIHSVKHTVTPKLYYPTIDKYTSHLIEHILNSRFNTKETVDVIVSNYDGFLDFY